jgi:hypothetical protein
VLFAPGLAHALPAGGGGGGGVPLLSVGDDCELRLWLAEGPAAGTPRLRPLCATALGEKPNWVAVTPSGFVCVADTSDRVILYRLSSAIESGLSSMDLS